MRIYMLVISTEDTVNVCRIVTVEHSERGWYNITILYITSSKDVNMVDMNTDASHHPHFLDQ